MFHKKKLNFFVRGEQLTTILTCCTKKQIIVKKTIEHLQEFGKTTCHPYNFGKTRKKRQKKWNRITAKPRSHRCTSTRRNPEMFLD